MVCGVFFGEQRLHLSPGMYSLVGVDALRQVTQNGEGMPLHIQIQYGNLERGEILRFIDHDMVKALSTFVTVQKIMDIQQRRKILLAQNPLLQAP